MAQYKIVIDGKVYLARSNRRYCDCGNRAVTVKCGEPICKRCEIAERNYYHGKLTPRRQRSTPTENPVRVCRKIVRRKSTMVNDK